MKTLNYINWFVVGLPIVLGILGIIWDDFLFSAIFSTMLTGIFQGITGILLFISKPKHKGLRIYAIGLFGYLISLFIISQIDYNEIMILSLVILPVLLAVYFSVLLFKMVFSKSTNLK